MPVADWNERPQCLGILRLDGAGGMVGECAIQLEIEGDQLAGQMREDLRHDHPRHAIARVHRDFERAHLRHIDEREDMAHIVVGHIALDHLPLARRFRRIARQRQIANRVAARLGADGDGLLAAHLQPVVLLGVVRGRHHDASGIAKLADGEI